MSNDYKEKSTYNEIESSADSSVAPSRPGSPGEYLGGSVQQKKSKLGRVRFNSHNETNDTGNKKFSVPLKDRGQDSDLLGIAPTPPKSIRSSPLHSRNNSATSLLRHTPDIEKDNPFDSANASPVLKPRPGVLRNSSYIGHLNDLDEDGENEKSFSALAAQERAQKITASLIKSASAGPSRRASVDDDSDTSHVAKPTNGQGYFANIPLGALDSRRTYDGAGDTDEEINEKPKKKSKSSSSTSEAHNLVRQHTRKHFRTKRQLEKAPIIAPSGPSTPVGDYGDDYVPKPQQYRGGVLSSLLKLYNSEGGAVSSRPGSRTQSRRGSFESEATAISVDTSGATTPKSKKEKWYNQKNNQSQDTLAGLVAASAKLAAAASPAQIGAGSPTTPTKNKPVRPGMGKKTNSGRIIQTLSSFTGRGPRLEDEIKITIHIAETLSRQKYIVKLCKALVQYGAPTHRLEEYLKMSSRVLEIDAQFLYIPDCMMISFGDATTHTSEFKLVKSKQGVNLGKLKDVHEIYKEVVHDCIGVEEATQRLDKIMTDKNKYNPWFLVMVYGFASATVAPFAFEGRLIDMPICFILGCIVGTLQLIVAPKSDLYSNVFEISAAVITSFLGRAFGSIRGGELFCFSALAQSSITLILPGYMVLCASLELQSRSIIAGSVRMVYAIIYSLFLGYGITIGTALYSIFDANATTATTCTAPISPYFRWLFVPLFTLCLTTINQAKWKQVPVMISIAFTGYVVDFFSARRFPSSPQISNTLGALAVGILGNLYSRIHHGLAAAALLPAIFVQVPSGLAASGSLLAGLSSADQITNSSTYANGTARVNGTSSVSVTSTTDLNTIVFNVGYSMIQVAIGITVGLFLSALIVYPLGKRRSGLFSF